MRERVLAFVRAIVKSTHLNMNKSCAVGSLIRLSVHPFIRMSVRPFVRPARTQRRRRLAYPTWRSVLHICIYGLLNGDRLQIRRAVNQTSSGPHHARTIPLAPRWALLPCARRAAPWPIKYWVHGADGTHRRILALSTTEVWSFSSSRDFRASRANQSPVIYHKWIKYARKEIMTHRVVWKYVRKLGDHCPRR